MSRNRLFYRSPVGDGPRRFSQWLLDLKGKSGAYVIRDAETKTILYVGESHTGRLSTTAKRHLWVWKDDAERVHNTYNPESVEIAFRVTANNRAIEEQNYLINKLEPIHNINGYEPEEPF